MSETAGMSSFSCGNISSAASGRGQFPSPYVDYTSTYVWRNLTELFDWSEFSYLMTPEIREAMRRLISPFVTPITIKSVDPMDKAVTEDEEVRLRRTLEFNMQWSLHAYLTLLNVVFYGNDFISVMSPIDRWLTCTCCGRSRKIRDMGPEDKVSYAKGKFKAQCSNETCRKKGPIEHTARDQREKDPTKFKIKHWPVRQIILRHYEIPEETEIFWDIPGTVKNAVKANDLLTLATIDKEMLKCCENNTLYKFKSDRIFHAKEMSLSSLKTYGWGLARVTGLHKQSWLLHLLRKSVQSISLDLNHPIKVVSPDVSPVVSPTSMGPMQAKPFGEFSADFNRILASHRRDPTRWHTSPQPVRAEYLGGNANQLFPHDMISMTKEDLVDAAGLPVELYKGSLSANASPMGLRLFEVQNGTLVTILNSAVQFVAQRVTEMASIDPVFVEHQPVKLVDDMQRLSLIAQLASGGNIAMAELYKLLGMSQRDDLNAQFREQQLKQDFQEKSEEMARKEQESAAIMQGLQAPPPPPEGAAPAGGDPAAMAMPPDPASQPGSLPSNGFAPPASLMQFESAASSLAETLSTMPEPQRNVELKLLRDNYPTFHAVVMQRLDQVRYQQMVQGRQAMMGG